MYDRARQDPDGRKWVDQNLGKLSDEKIAQMKEEGRIFVTKTGNLRRKQYLDEMEGVLLNPVWGDIPIINSQAIERADYPTQKPLELLKRIIKTSTSENDLVFDCFMGVGGSLLGAALSGRKAIGIELNRTYIEAYKKAADQIGLEIYPTFCGDCLEILENKKKMKELLLREKLD